MIKDCFAVLSLFSCGSNMSKTGYIAEAIKTLQNRP
jgi:hypothetical protein